MDKYFSLFFQVDNHQAYNTDNIPLFLSLVENIVSACHSKNIISMNYIYIYLHIYVQYGISKEKQYLVTWSSRGQIDLQYIYIYIYISLEKDITVEISW